MITIVLDSNYVPYIEMLLQKEKPQNFATSKVQHYATNEQLLQHRGIR